MERNFFRRIEVAFPVLSPKLRARIRADLDIYLEDNANAWLLQPDGTYVHAVTDPSTAADAQARLLENYAAAARLPE